MSFTGTGLAVRSPSALTRRAAPPRSAGLGGFFDDQLPNFFKKAVRYQGALIVSPFVDQPRAKKIFGLSQGESKVFQITANIQRAVALVAAGAGAYGAFQSAAAAKAAAAASAKALPLSTGFQFTTTAAPTFAASAAPAAAPLAAAAAPAAAASSAGAAASSGGLFGVLKGAGAGIGKLVLGGAVLGKVLGQGGSVIRESAQIFSEGYRETSGQNLPINDILSLAKQAAAEVRNRFAPEPAAGAYVTPEGVPVIEAGVNWPIVLGAGALAFGAWKLAKGKRR